MTEFFLNQAAILKYYFNILAICWQKMALYRGKMTKFYKICALIAGIAALTSCVELMEDPKPRPRIKKQVAAQVETPAPQQTKDPFEYTPPQPSELAYTQSVGYYNDGYGNYAYDVYPNCGEETMVVVYDDAGAYQVPGCVMEENEQPAAIQPKNEAKTQSEDEEEINPDDIEGEFPSVENNKYHKKQIVMQNLQTRVIAYCRGDEDAMEECVKRLECSGYTQLRNVPTLPAKYDLLRKGSYPTRRWREGENVPRW